MKKRTVLACVLVMIFAAAIPALAWDGPGHMLVADIAWAQLLAAPAAQVIAAILRNAKGPFMPAGNSDDQIRDAFDFAATFPDYIKGHSNSDYEPLVDQMNLTFWPHHTPPGGNEGLRCRSWHYYDTPIRYPFSAPTVQPSNAIVAHQEAVMRLRQLHLGTYNGPNFPGASQDDLKFWWLGWILHLTGDLHQPLHCVSNYGVPGNIGKSDNGGNGFKLAGGKKLHSLWDGLLDAAASADGVPIGNVDSAGSPSAILSAVSAAWEDIPVTIGTCADLNLTNWIADQAALADSTVYDGLQPGDPITAAYMNAAEALGRQEAVLAGCRLAGVLTNVFS